MNDSTSQPISESSPPANTSNSFGTSIYFFSAVAAFIALVAFLPALRNGFVNWDDYMYVCKNLHIRALDGDMLLWAFTNLTPYWHPLTWISLAVDFAVWGLNPVGYHLTNVIFHALNTFLTALIIFKLMTYPATRETDDGSGQNDDTWRRKSLFVSFLSALLFGIHPLHVESVAWVSERKDVLYALFFLLSIISHVQHAGDRDRAGLLPGRLFSKKQYALSFVFFALALMSKPMAVTIPVVLLLLDWYPLRRMQGPGSLKTVLGEKLPFFALSALGSVATIYAQWSLGAISTASPLATRVFMAVNALVAYILKMLVPINLSPFYPYPRTLSVTDARTLISLLLLASFVSASLVLLRYKQKIYPAVFGYYLITMLPAIGIVQPGFHSMADRFSYLPSIGPFVLFSCGAYFVLEKTVRNPKFGGFVKTTVFLIALVLPVLLLVQTYRQIKVWENDVTLWTRAVAVGPPNYIAYNNMGNALLAAHRAAEAVVYYEKSNQVYFFPGLYPYYEDNLLRLAQYYQETKELDKAFMYAQKAQEMYASLVQGPDPRFPEAYNTMGEISFVKRDYRKASEYFRIALSREPAKPAYLFNSAVALERLGSIREACLSWSKYVDTNQPNNDEVLGHMKELECRSLQVSGTMVR